MGGPYAADKVSPRSDAGAVWVADADDAVHYQQFSVRVPGTISRYYGFERREHARWYARRVPGGPLVWPAHNWAGSGSSLDCVADKDRAVRVRYDLAVPVPVVIPPYHPR